MLTKAVGGKEYPASSFAFVGDPKDISTWHLLIEDAGHVRDAMARFNQTDGIPSDKKGEVIRKILARAKHFGIDASGFASEHNVKAEWDSLADESLVEIRTELSSPVQPAEGDPWGFDFQIMQAGPANVYDGESGLQFFFTPDFIRNAASSFEGQHCYENHQPKLVGDFGAVRGFWNRVKSEADGSRMTGRLNLLSSEGKTREKLASAAARGKENLVGCSIHAAVTGKAAVIGGKKYYVPTDVVRDLPRSVDLVPVGGAGGFMVRAAAANNLEDLVTRFSRTPAKAGGSQPEEGKGRMKERILKMLAAIKGWDAGRATTVEAQLAELPETEETKRLAAVSDVFIELATKQIAAAAASGNGTGEEVKQLKAQLKELSEASAVSAKQAKIAACSATLTQKLADSKLPMPARASVKRHFEGREFEEKDLDAEITAVRAEFASMVPDTHATYPVVAAGLCESDKCQVALDKLFGLTKDAKGKDLPSDVPSFKGIREAYAVFTGDPEVTGRPDVKRVSAIFNNAGFPNALANTMTRQLLKDYAAVDYGWKRVVSNISNAENFKTQERIRVGYFGDLSTVDPEAADYQELAAYTDEKISYSVIQKGNLVTVTRKMIINDDLNSIVKVNGRLGRSAARTLAKRIWNLFITNALYDVDGVATFHATHNNLSALAYGADALTDMDQKLFAQTEKDSNERLGLTLVAVVVPNELYATALSINNSERLPTGPGIYVANPWFKRFGQNGENIFRNPLMTDATDFIGLADPALVDIIEVGFLQGRQEPEFFLADAIPSEQVFVADKIRYKIRHEYEADVLDFRGAVKSVQ